ncbi:uncharacterized protein EI90DRAFT_3093079 [Cantharellus anzutake]|uniref:uncharacterized protein n=1 Tax=Cantharellus anzutake TaxID=1750568 RepID=UPI001907D9BD|nr:uncharacterized protein EI90DRAFT_3093079 [Cantharellus anzutake]KAF8312732.1 hypothetical protein EI90DRAFT_3093079 [Cantharellus anzutake]
MHTRMAQRRARGSFRYCGKGGGGQTDSASPIASRATPRGPRPNANIPGGPTGGAHVNL